jgi:cell wall-associated NlpC family hydrolase
MSNTRDIVLRIIGEPEDALRALKQVGAATSSYTVTVEQQAKKTVGARARERQSSQQLIAEYKKLAEGAKKGSAEQVAALQAIEREQRKLGTATKHNEETSTVSLGKIRHAVIGVAAGYMGAQGLLAVTEHAAHSAADLGAAVDASTVIFGRNGKGIQDWSKGLLHDFGLAEGTALDFANQVGRMLKGVELAPGRVAEMSKSIVELDSDISALTHHDPGAFVAAFDQAVAGRTRGLKQFSVFIDDASIKAEALRLGLVKAAVDTGKLSLAQDRVAIATAKAAKAQHDYGASSTQAHTAQDELTRAEAALDKLLQGKVPKLTAAQRAEAIYAITIKQTADAHGYFAKHADRADLVDRRLHEGMKQVYEIAGTALLPTLTNLAGGMADWLSKSENQEKVQHAVAGAVHDVSEALGIAIPLVETAWHDADSVAKAMGGWKHVIELLIAMKIGVWALGVATQIKGVAIAEEAAATKAGTLRAALLALGDGSVVAALAGIAAGLGDLFSHIEGHGTSSVPGAGSPVDLGHPLHTSPIASAIGFGGSHGLPVGEDIGDAADWDVVYKGGRYFVKIKGKWYPLSAAAAAAGMGVSVGQLRSMVKKAAATQGPLTSPTGAPTTADATRAAAPYSNVPYQWGGGHGGQAGPSFASGHGRTGIGLDCSGYARAVLKNLLGIDVSGTADSLLSQATSHPSLVELAPGDLVFYEGMHPNHVMVYLGRGKVIGETHTGEQGPQVKAVNYLPITGTGRYWPRKGATNRLPPSTKTDAAGPPPAAPPQQTPLVVGTKPKPHGSTHPLVPNVMSEAVAHAKAEVRGALNAWQKDKALQDEISALLTMQKALEQAEKTATGKRKEQIRKALDKVASDLAGARKELAQAIKKENEQIAKSREHDDLAHQLAELLNVPAEAMGAWGPEGEGGVEGVLRRKTTQVLKALKRSILSQLAQVAREIKADKRKYDEIMSLDPNLQVTGATDDLGRPLPPTTMAAVQAKIRKLYQAYIHASGEQKVRLGRELAKAIDEGIDMATAAVSAAQSRLEDALSRVDDKLLAGFDRVTQAQLQAMQRAAQQQMDEINRELDQRIAAMQRKLAARIQQIEAAGAQLTPAEQALQDLQSQHDAAQMAQDLADAQQALAEAQASGDQQAIVDAQRRLDDLLYQQKVAALQKQAEAERAARDKQTQDQIQALEDQEAAQEQALRDQTAQVIQALEDQEAAREQDYQDQRDAQREWLQQQLDDWNKHLLDGSASWQDFMNWLAGQGASGVLAGVDIPDPIQAMADAGSAQGSAFAQAYIAELHAAWQAYQDFLAGQEPVYQPPANYPTGYDVGGTIVQPGQPGQPGGGGGAAAPAAAGLSPALRSALARSMIDSQNGVGVTRVYQPPSNAAAVIAAQQAQQPVLVDLRGALFLEKSPHVVRDLARLLEPHLGKTVKVIQ